MCNSMSITGSLLKFVSRLAMDRKQFGLVPGPDRSLYLERPAILEHFGRAQWTLPATLASSAKSL